jgi:hypothetical protein
VIGFLSFALTEETVTSFSSVVFKLSLGFSCEKEKREKKIKNRLK